MKTARLLLVLLALAGCSDGGSGGGKPITFALYGDCRTGNDVHRRICKSILETDASFVVVSGDLVDEGDDEESWKAFREITKDLRARVPYFVVKGDHDQGNKWSLEREFRLEKPWYDKEVEGIHFFFLDSTAGFGIGEQLSWLEQRAAGSKALHKIAVFHHPPFSAMPRRAGSAEHVRTEIHGMLVKLKFCAALCGHDHHFYTTSRDGVRYVISAGGGASLYHPDPKQGQRLDLMRRFHHFVLLHKQGKEIAAQVYDESGVEARDLGFGVCSHP